MFSTDTDDESGSFTRIQFIPSASPYGVRTKENVVQTKYQINHTESPFSLPLLSWQAWQVGLANWFMMGLVWDLASSTCVPSVLLDSWPSS